MKKLLALIVLIVLASCTPHKPYSVITKVRKATTQWCASSYKYVVYTNDDLKFYSDENYHVGDTIYISKRK